MKQLKDLSSTHALRICDKISNIQICAKTENAVHTYVCTNYTLMQNLMFVPWNHFCVTQAYAMIARKYTVMLLLCQIIGNKSFYKVKFLVSWNILHILHEIFATFQ